MVVAGEGCGLKGFFFFLTTGYLYGVDNTIQWKEKWWRQEREGTTPQVIPLGREEWTKSSAEQGKLAHAAGETGQPLWKSSLVVSYQTQQSPSKVLTQEKGKFVFTLKPRHSSSITGNQRPGTIQMSFQQVNKLVYPYNGMLLNNEKGQNVDTATWIDLKGINAEWKNPVLRGYILYYSIHITLPQRQN